MPASCASSSWSGGQPLSLGSSSPVTAGLCASTSSPAAAIAASSAALSTVLPTPVSVPVTSRPRTWAPARSGGAGYLSVALVIEDSRGGGTPVALAVKRRGGALLDVE